MNENIVSKTSEYFKKKGIVLPKISELCNPLTIDKSIINKLKTVDKDAMDPLNLFRVHWFNGREDTEFLRVPEHIILPSEFTGVETKIIVNYYSILWRPFFYVISKICLKEYQEIFMIIMNIKLQLREKIN